MVQYFEDIDTGETYCHGTVTVTESEIVAFAERFDPQPMHTDPDAAEETMFCGLIASGWHTAGLCTRLLVDAVEAVEWALVGASGLEELEWHRPVRPGDSLRISFETLEKYPAENSPTFGYVDYRLTGYNQNDDRVISWIAHAMIERRDSRGK